MNYRRVAIGAGHGIGKTRFAASAVHWFMATRPTPAIVCTANTETQLRTKLWRELRKVNQAAKNGHLFKWNENKFTLAPTRPPAPSPSPGTRASPRPPPARMRRMC